jgi:hypothetical protein
MQEVQFDIDIDAEFYNHWPYIKVLVNDVEYYDAAVEGSVTISITAHCDHTNTLCIIHHGKNFGNNGIWDSSSDGVQSCSATITDIRFNTVSIGESMMSKLEFNTTWSDDDSLDAEFKTEYERFNSNGVMSFNGSLLIEFETPIYNWLTIAKYKVPMTTTAAFSNYSLRWHYDDDIAIINDIKKLIDNG